MGQIIPPGRNRILAAAWEALYGKPKKSAEPTTAPAVKTAAKKPAAKKVAKKKAKSRK